MTTSRRVPSGYLEINHRDSPGISLELAAQVGRDTLPVGRGMQLQSDTYKCCNCQRMIVKNPLRTRERNWCTACDSYICDVCAVEVRQTGVHIPFKKRLDELYDRLTKGG